MHVDDFIKVFALIENIQKRQDEKATLVSNSGTPTAQQGNQNA